MPKYIAPALAALALFLALSSARSQTAVVAAGTPPHGGAVVLDFSGKVRVHAASGSPLPIVRNGILPQGARIETDANSKVLLRLEDGSEILLRDSSQLSLVQESLPSGTTLFELLLGRLRAVVTKRFTGKPSFQLGTPSAIVAVRGTKFDVEVNPHHVTEVDVEQGLVQVTGRSSLERSVLLEPGFSTRVGLDRIPEPPLPTSRIRPDPREAQENKDTKKLRSSKNNAAEPAGTAPETHQGTEPPEPAEPAQTQKPAPQ